MSKNLVELGADGCSVVINLKKGTDPIVPLTSYSDEAQTVIRELLNLNYTARMQFREEFDSEVIDELTTDNSRIVLGDGDPNIQLIFTQAALANYPEQCFGDLELIDANGKVAPVDSIRFQCNIEDEYTHD